MTRNRTQPQAPARPAALLRLGVLALAVTCAFATVAIVMPGSPHDLQDLAAGQGPATALGFIAVGALLALALFPFPVLAGASGLLFGAVLGGGIAVAAETTGALAALLISRRWGARPLAQLAGARLHAVLDGVGRRGFVAVLYARTVPGVPRGIANYAFGMTPVRPVAFVAATALGTAPRAFAYAALGSSSGIGRLDSPAAIAAAIALVANGVLGAALLARERRS